MKQVRTRANCSVWHRKNFRTYILPCPILFVLKSSRFIIKQKCIRLKKKSHCLLYLPLPSILMTVTQDSFEFNSLTFQSRQSLWDITNWEDGQARCHRGSIKRTKYLIEVKFSKKILQLLNRLGHEYNRRLFSLFLIQVSVSILVKSIS